MYYEHLNHDAFSDQILIGMMTYLSEDMMRRFQGTMESSYSSSHTRGLEDFLVLNYIQEHIDTVTLTDISRHFGFSLSYCSKLIKNTTGMGFSEWKRALRVRKGERLLVNTTDTVNDISLSLGYENTETFIRIFKKETGMTPGQYRKRGQKRPAD
jgi:AraC-like DNA-binding protein